MVRHWERRGQEAFNKRGAGFMPGHGQRRVAEDKQYKPPHTVRREEAWHSGGLCEGPGSLPMTQPGLSVSSQGTEGAPQPVLLGLRHASTCPHCEMMTVRSSCGDVLSFTRHLSGRKNSWLQLVVIFLHWVAFCGYQIIPLVSMRNGDIVENVFISVPLRKTFTDVRHWNEKMSWWVFFSHNIW